jgi:thiol-disulfide isomerase/thioredoxin
MLKIVHALLCLLWVPLIWGQTPSSALTAQPPNPVLKSEPKLNKIDILPYATGQWHSMLQHQLQAPSNAPHPKDWVALNKPMVVHFWGVTCGPCLSEMPQWGTFVADNAQYKVVFIQVDDVSTGIMAHLLSKAHLAQALNYKLTTPFDEFMRYEIDTQWGGETPYTVLVSAQGQQTPLNGLVNFTKLKKWFQQNS